jgi:hypothetical protein
MPVQSYRNLNLLFNNEPVFANNIAINNSLDIIPVYYRGEEMTDKRNANSGPKGSVKLSYFLTGNDILADYIYATGFISGFLGGYSFRSGSLTSYSFNAEPNTPVNIDAEIVFFDPLTGRFGGQSLAKNPNLEILDFSNSTITFTNGFNSNLESVLGLNYNYQQEIIPVYKSQQVYPNEINHGPKIVSIQLLTDSNSGMFTNYIGEGIVCNLLLKDKAGNNKLGFVIDGFIKNKQISTNNDSFLKTTYDISQFDVVSTISVSGFSPTSGYYFSNVSVSGANVDNIISLIFNNIAQNSLIYDNTYRVRTTVPENSLSGTLSAVLLNGNLLNLGLFHVLDSGINITSFSPVTGTYFN